MKQAEVNIGLFGHVDHGKTTLVKQITGKWTDTHSEELKRGISIRIGYADVNVYYCNNCDLYFTEEKCPSCGKSGSFKRRISFVDSPGHESLMANAIAASSIIDGALFLIAANEDFPQEQTKEHLEMLKLIGIKNIVVVHTKLDLVDKSKAINQKEKIVDYFKRELGFEPVIIPISATYGLNIDKVIKALQLYIPTPKRNKSKNFIAFVLRSFDVNKPGTKPANLVGGVLGVTISEGKVKVGDEIIILPGYPLQKTHKPLRTSVVSLRDEELSLEEATPGGLIAIGTKLDPALTKSDILSGNIVVDLKTSEKVNVVEKEVRLKYSLIKRKDFENPLLKEGEPLLINVNTATTAGVIVELKKGIMRVILKRAVAVVGDEKWAISRRIGNRWRLSVIAEMVK